MELINNPNAFKTFEIFDRLLKTEARFQLDLAEREA